MTQKIVVLGAGYAGILCAARVARQTQGKAEVILLSQSEQFVERVRLHQRAAGAIAEWTIPALLQGSSARFVRARATGIVPERQQVLTEQGALRYDRLVYALGSHVDTQSVPGVAEHAYRLDGGCAERLAAALPAVAAERGRLLVCGGGLSGIEAASELAEALPALRVTLVTSGELGDSLSQRGRSYLRQTLRRLHVEVIEQTPVLELAPGSARTAAGGVPFSLCLWAGGFRCPPLAAAAGLAVNGRGQVLVDEALRSRSQPAIYAIGDAAAVPEACGPVVMSCKLAMPMGAHAADHLAAELHGGPARPFRFGDGGVCISLGRRLGMVQRRQRDGRSTEQVVTGRLGAWLKERVCRYTVFSLRMESRGLLRYRWLAPAASSPPAAARLAA